MKSETQIKALIRKIENEIKKTKPTIKSMGSNEARQLERLKGKLESYEDVIHDDHVFGVAMEPLIESVDVDSYANVVAVNSDDK